MSSGANSSIQYYNIPGFQFVGGTKKEIKVAYRIFNDAPTAKGTVLIPTCFGGKIDTTLNFTSGALKEYRVVVVAMLGNGESSSPSNDAHFSMDYSLRYEDCINSQYALLTKHLGVKSLEAVIGFSMAGQQAYYWAVMHGSSPEPFVKRSVVICGSAKTSGLNYTFLEGPITALRTSHDYDQGRYRENGREAVEGVRAFGAAYAAWLTSAEWFRQELWKTPSVESGPQSLHEWVHPPKGRPSLFEGWDPEDLLALARMWQAADVGAVSGHGDYRKALANVTAKVLVMPCETDQYFCVEDGKTEADHLKNGIFDPIPSIWGHIAGGGANPKDAEWMDKKIADFVTS